MTVDLSKSSYSSTEPPAPVDPRVRRRSRSAVARSAGGDRWLTVLIGLVLLLVGAAAAPALRVTLWLADDADVRAVLARLHGEVLATATGRVIGAHPSHTGRPAP